MSDRGAGGEGDGGEGDGGGEGLGGGGEGDRGSEGLGGRGDGAGGDGDGSGGDGDGGDKGGGQDQLRVYQPDAGDHARFCLFSVKGWEPDSPEVGASGLSGNAEVQL